ncbi:hypothetical protein C8Q79DRAFT_904019, partial [Trametes meyenii]
ISALGLLYYDYIITLHTEMRLVWHSPLSFGKVFFLLIRYGFIVDMSLVLFYTVRLSPGAGPALTVMGCQALYTSATVVQLMNFASVSAFVALRIASLWSHSWPLGISLFLFGLFNPSTITNNAVGLTPHPQAIGLGFQMNPTPWPMSACVQTLRSNAASFALIAYVVKLCIPIAASAVSITYEFLCLSLTVFKTLGVYREQCKCGMRPTLTRLLLRDGQYYTFSYSYRPHDLMLPARPTRFSIFRASLLRLMWLRR